MTQPCGRRRLLVSVTALAALPAIAAPALAQLAGADSESFEKEQAAIVAGRTPVATGVTIDMPQLSENGNAVELTVRVDSPMTAADHVRAIHVLSEKNPAPRVASFYLTPRAGRAQVSTRIRLASTQRVVVIAETSAGALLRAEREVIVVLGACVDGG